MYSLSLIDSGERASAATASWKRFASASQSTSLPLAFRDRARVQAPSPTSAARSACRARCRSVARSCRGEGVASDHCNLELQ